MSKHADDLPPKTKERLYTIWTNMWGRVRDKKNPWYGGRGVTAAEEFSNYAEFRSYILLSLRRLPEPNESLDRISNDRGYEPGNLRWATAKEQGRNRRGNRQVVVDGKEMPLATAVDLYGVVSYSHVRNRLQSGWPIWEALTTPGVRHKLSGRSASHTRRDT